MEVNAGLGIESSIVVKYNSYKRVLICAIIKREICEGTAF